MGMRLYAGLVGVVGAVLMAGCGERPVPPPPKAKAAKAPHCFFKDADAKDWKIAAQGDQLVITGRAYRADPRYKATFLKPEMDGRVVVLRPSITVNDTGFAADGDWWDIKTSVPAAAVDRVEVRCGQRLLATLPVDRPAG